MESLPRSLNYELSHDLHFDKYAQQILENSKTVIASTPTITTFDASTTSSSDFLQKLGASLINSIQLQHLHKTRSSESATSGSQLDMEFPPHRVVLDTSTFDSLDDMQKQLEYDKFMNEVWIGIVLTLILISMVFCVCSCFLYHQFRTWKRNYHNTVSQAQDLESMKLQPDLEDPVPEYTLVSGLPSYEAALELLHKTPKSCLLVYPSVFSVFNANEKTPTDIATTMQTSQEQQQVVELTTPLLSTTTTPTAQTSTQETVKSATSTIPTYAEATNMTAVILTAATVNEKASMQARISAIAMEPATAITTTAAAASNVTYQRAPSYEEAFCMKSDKS